MASLYLWKKTVTTRQVDAWLERVAPTVAADRLVVVAPVSGRTQSLQAYVDSASEARALVTRFGGKTSEITTDDWLPAPSTSPGKPLAFGRHLLVTGHEEELTRLRALYPRRQVLCIPAAMAFGSGEHATTAMCLRILSEFSVRQRGGEPWNLLDLGTGSGVLALAGRMCGARQATGYDNDPHAVRTARENAQLNGVTGTHFRPLDLLREDWSAGPAGGWPVIAANLFSELLISLLPRIAFALREEGELIASGILASQAPEVEAALRAQAMELVMKRRRGRWVAYLARKHR